MGVLVASVYKAVATHTKPNKQTRELVLHQLRTVAELIDLQDVSISVLEEKIREYEEQLQLAGKTIKDIVDDIDAEDDGEPIRTPKRSS